MYKDLDPRPSTQRAAAATVGAVLVDRNNLPVKAECAHETNGLGQKQEKACPEGFTGDVGSGWSRMPDALAACSVSTAGVYNPTRDVYTIHTDGSHFVQLSHTLNSVLLPQFTQDGKHIIFAELQAEAPPIMRMMDIDGGNMLTIPVAEGAGIATRCRRFDIF